jgi:hypothetical protein
VPLLIDIDVISASYLFSQVEGLSPCPKAGLENKDGTHEIASARKTAPLLGLRIMTENMARNYLLVNESVHFRKQE